MKAILKVYQTVNNKWSTAVYSRTIHA